MTINEEWEESIKRLWENNKRHIREGVLYEFGAEDAERKLDDFLAIGPQPWSVVAMHNRNLRAIRKAFVTGAHLTGPRLSVQPL